MYGVLGGLYTVVLCNFSYVQPGSISLVWTMIALSETAWPPDGLGLKLSCQRGSRPTTRPPGLMAASSSFLHTQWRTALSGCQVHVLALWSRPIVVSLQDKTRHCSDSVRSRNSGCHSGAENIAWLVCDSSPREQRQAHSEA